MPNELFPDDDQTPPLSLRPVEEPEVQAEEPKVEDLYAHRVPKWGPTWLSWILITAMVGFIMVSVFLVQMQQVKPGSKVSKGVFFQPVFLGKLVVGLGALAEETNVPNLRQNQGQMLQSLQGGSVEQRMCKAILLAEVDGPAAGSISLAEIGQRARKVEYEFTSDQKRLESILESIFEVSVAKRALEVSQEDQGFLKEQLPWYGELALLPKHLPVQERSDLLGRSKISLLLFFGGIILALIVALVSLAMLVIFCVQLARQRFYSRMVDNSKYGPVYAETFALWLGLWLAMSFAIGLKGGGGLSLPTVLLTMLLPLSALIWPIFRGVPANEMMLDIGMKPTNPFKEMFFGFLAYLAVIPLMALSLICTVVLAAVQGMLQSAIAPIEKANEFASTGVAHPIIAEAFSGNAMEVMTLVFVTACILAPFTEEIMFRGVLFRHLRDSTSRMSRGSSVIIAALISSFVFAAIHPQGLVGIPPLMTLAIAFCLVRQWRGSLIAPMTMHLLNNMMPTSIMLPVVI